MSLLSQHPVGRGAVFLGRNLSFQFTLGWPCPAPHHNPFHRGPGIRRCGPRMRGLPLGRRAAKDVCVRLRREQLWRGRRKFPEDLGTNAYRLFWQIGLSKVSSPDRAEL